MLSPAFMLLFWATATGLVLGVGVSVGMVVKRARTRTALAWLACVASGELAISIQLEFASRCAVALTDVARMLGAGVAVAVVAAALALRWLRNSEERPRLARVAPLLAAALVILFVADVGRYLLESCGSWDVEEFDYGQS